VNPLKEKNKSSEPVSKKNKAEFDEVKKNWFDKMAAANDQAASGNSHNLNAKN
jgi:hypothetical protein